MPNILGLADSEDIGTLYRIQSQDRANPVEAFAIDGSLLAAVPTIIAANSQRLLRSAAAAIAGDWQVLSPLGGGSDDVPRVHAALGLGPVQLLPGTYNALTASLWPSASILRGGPGVVWNNQVPTGSVTNAVIGAGANANVAFGHVVTSPVFGSRSWLNSAAIPIGTFIQLAANALQGSVYLVTGSDAAGGGNFTITVERPILFSIPALQSVFGYPGNNIPHDIYVFGEGMQIVGPGGQRAIEMLGVRRGLISNVIVDQQNAGSGDFAVSLDVGTFDFHLIGVEVYNTIASIGIAAESVEQGSFQRCGVQQLANVTGVGVGINVLDCSIFYVDRHCWTRDCQIGGAMSSDGENGCWGCMISGSYIGSTNASADGFIVEQGAQFCAITDMQILFGAGFGLHTVNNGALDTDVRISNVQAQGNVRGIVLEATNLHVLTNVDVTGNRDNGLFVGNGAVVVATGGQSSNGNDSTAFLDGFGACIYVDNGGDGTFTDWTIRNTTSPVAGWSAIRGGRLAGGTVAKIACDNVRIFQSTGSNTFGFDMRGNAANSGQMSLSNCQIQATGPNSIAVHTDGGDSLYLGNGNSLDAVTLTVLQVNGPSNLVTFNAPGSVVPQVFAYPMARTGMIFTAMMTTRGGTQIPLLYAVVNGVSFSVAAGAADTSSYTVSGR